jgi:hypothetical protein
MDKLNFKIILLQREQYYLDTLLFAQNWINKIDKKFNLLGYNICPIAKSCLGLKHSIETKLKLSKVHKGIKFTKEHKEKIKIANTGLKRSLQSIENIRNSQIGKKHSAKAKENMRIAQTGRKHSKETKDKISIKHKNKILSNETKDKIKKSWSLRIIHKCPHCLLESNNLGNMNRYHFDNCKLK